MKEGGLSGISLHIKQGTSYSERPISYSLDLGMENPDTGKPIDSLTVFPAGSLGEPIVAYMVLKLAAVGQIDLDRPLYRYLGTPLPGDSDWASILTDERARRLTARLVLSHQSGLAFSRQAMPDRRLRLETTPGDSFGYSEDAYSLLYPVLESISGRPFHDLAKAMVFEPSGMPRSSFGWEDRFEGHVPRPMNGGANPMNVFFTSAADFDKFVWLFALFGGDLPTEYLLPYMGFPTISVKTASMKDHNRATSAASLPKGLSWFLGWGRYELPNVLLGNGFFVGGRKNGIESYATAFESRNSTALTVLLIGPGGHSMMSRILKEILGEIESPLAWMGL